VCTANVLCNLSIICYKFKVFVVERDIPTKLKNHSFPDTYFSLFSCELTLEVCLHVLGTPPYIQVDSKRWTQLKSKQRFNTRQRVGCGTPSSLLALRLKRRRNAYCTAVADSVLMNSRKQKHLVLCSSHFALN